MMNTHYKTQLKFMKNYVSITHYITKCLSMNMLMTTPKWTEQ